MWVGKKKSCRSQTQPTAKLFINETLSTFTCCAILMSGYHGFLGLEVKGQSLPIKPQESTGNLSWKAQKVAWVSGAIRTVELHFLYLPPLCVTELKQSFKSQYLNVDLCLETWGETMASCNTIRGRYLSFCWKTCLFLELNEDSQCHICYWKSPISSLGHY